MKKYVGIGVNKDVTVVRADDDAVICVEIRAIAAGFENDVAGTICGDVCGDGQVSVGSGDFDVCVISVINYLAGEREVSFNFFDADCASTVGVVGVVDDSNATCISTADGVNSINSEPVSGCVADAVYTVFGRNRNIVTGDEETVCVLCDVSVGCGEGDVCVVAVCGPGRRLSAGRGNISCKDEISSCTCSRDDDSVGVASDFICTVLGISTRCCDVVDRDITVTG